MPGEVAQAMLDVTAADAGRRLDQMSVITLTAHAWELTRKACLQMGTGSEGARGPERYYRSSADELMASQEVGIWTTVLSASGETERIDAVFDVERSEGEKSDGTSGVKPAEPLS